MAEPDGQQHEDRPEPEQPLFRCSQSLAEPLDRAEHDPARRRIGGGRRRVDRGRLTRGRDVDEDQVGLAGVGLGQQVDRAIVVEPCERDGPPAERWIRGRPRGQDSPTELESPAALAVERRADEAGCGEHRRRQRHAVVEQLGDAGPKLGVEHPDDDPDPRVELLRGQRDIEVVEVLVARHDDRGSRLDAGFAEGPRLERVTDDQPRPDPVHARRGRHRSPRRRRRPRHVAGAHRWSGGPDGRRRTRSRARAPMRAPRATWRAVYGRGDGRIRPGGVPRGRSPRRHGRPGAARSRRCGTRRGSSVGGGRTVDGA